MFVKQKVNIISYKSAKTDGQEDHQMQHEDAYLFVEMIVYLTDFFAQYSTCSMDLSKRNT